jgi:carbon storage regulator
MLVLARTTDQTIMIGDDIEITVVEVRGGKVRLGIKAPREVRVHRKEVWEAIRRENRGASQIQPKDLGGAGGGRRRPPGDGPAAPGETERPKKPPDYLGEP